MSKILPNSEEVLQEGVTDDKGELPENPVEKTAADDINAEPDAVEEVGNVVEEVQKVKEAENVKDTSTDDITTESAAAEKVVEAENCEVEEVSKEVENEETTTQVDQLEEKVNQAETSAPAEPTNIELETEDNILQTDDEKASKNLSHSKEVRSESPDKHTKPSSNTPGSSEELGTEKNLAAEVKETIDNSQTTKTNFQKHAGYISSLITKIVQFDEKFLLPNDVITSYLEIHVDVLARKNVPPKIVYTKILNFHRLKDKERRHKRCQDLIKHFNITPARAGQHTVYTFKDRNEKLKKRLDSQMDKIHPAAKRSRVSNGSKNNSGTMPSRIPSRSENTVVETSKLPESEFEVMDSF